MPLVGLDRDGDVNGGLEALRAARTDNLALRERLRGLSARYDDEYFCLDEEGDAGMKPEAFRLFAKARGTADLTFALSDDATELHEAIYEAMCALIDDSSKVARGVEEALGASS